jgi:D-glycero-D-manno-heptose 1,7-bisphosphate phosphatase
MGIHSVKAPGAKAVFLDRDGVLNKALVSNGKPYAPISLQDFAIEPDAAACLNELKRSGFVLVVVTNQPDVARGRQTESQVNEMHKELRRAVVLDDILTCFHDDLDECECRKPKPGLLFQAQDRYGLDLSQSYFIGDRWKDIEAGHAAGCKTVLIDFGYQERLPAKEPSARVASLREAVAWIKTQSAEE